jgi:hypothetical protein
MVGIGDQASTTPASTRTRVTAGYTIQNASTTTFYTLFPVPLDFMDAPGYTNVSYDLLVGSYGTGTSYVNRNHSFQNGAGSGSASTAYDLCPSSSLTFTELTP